MTQGEIFSNSDPDFLQNIQILSAKVSSRTCEIFHAHFIERLSQKFDNILPDSMGQSSRQAHKNVLGRNIVKIGERRLRILIHFLSKILTCWG